MQLTVNSLWLKPHSVKLFLKIVYVIRNPRDACMSFYAHWRILGGFTGSFDVFADAFLAGECGYNTPVLEHMIRYWEESKKPGSNILIIMFEDMKHNLEGVVCKVADFLGKNVPDTKMPELLEHLSFESMKSNPTVNKQKYVEV